MHHTDRILKNPCELWKVPRGTSERRRAMTAEEYAVLYASAPEWFRPVIAFIRLTGCRGASVEALKWEDVDFTAGVVRLKSRKGGLKKMKVIPIPLYPALEELLQSEKAKFYQSMSSPVFWGKLGTPVTAQEISTEGSRLIRKVLPGAKVVLYGLRHAIAVELTEAGVPLEITRQAMGHSSVQQTSHYAQGIRSSAVADAFAQIRTAKNETGQRKKKP